MGFINTDGSSSDKSLDPAPWPDGATTYGERLLQIRCRLSNHRSPTLPKVADRRRQTAPTPGQSAEERENPGSGDSLTSR